MTVDMIGNPPKKKGKSPLEKAEEHLAMLKRTGSGGGTSGSHLTKLVKHCEELEEEKKRLSKCCDAVQERYLEAKKLGLAKITDDLVLEDENVEWVVNSYGELGVKIGNQLFFLYKGRSLVYSGNDEREHKMYWRLVYKREFGETCLVPDSKIQGSKQGVIESDGYYRHGPEEHWKELP